MQISPYYEGVPFEAASISGTEYIEGFDQDDQNINGDFAQILAGLLREQEAQNTKIPDESPDEKSLLAQKNEIVIQSEPDSEGISAPEHKMRLFAGRAKQFAEENGISAEKSHTISNLPENQNLHFDVERLFESSKNRRISENGHRELNSDETKAAELSLETTQFTDKLEPALLASVSVNAGQVRKTFPESSEKLSLEKMSGKENKNLNASDTNMAFNGAKEAAGILLQNEGKKGRLEEARAKDKQLVLEIRDFRSNTSELQNNTELRYETRNAGFDLKAFDAGGVKALNMELHLPEGAKTPVADSNWGAKSALAFEDLLARELHQNFNNDIVRHASMILKDEGKGMIRMALKPDTLGHVKICLEMAENKIRGHIIVESEEALRAFQKEIQSLEQSFKESGFEEAYLEMSLAQDGRGAKEPGQEEQARAFLSGFNAASRYEAQDSVDTFHFGAFFPDRAYINVLA